LFFFRYPTRKCRAIICSNSVNRNSKASTLFDKKTTQQPSQRRKEKESQTTKQREKEGSREKRAAEDTADEM